MRQHSARQDAILEPEHAVRIDVPAMLTCSAVRLAPIRLDLRVFWTDVVPGVTYENIRPLDSRLGLGVVQPGMTDVHVTARGAVLIAEHGRYTGIVVHVEAGRAPQPAHFLGRRSDHGCRDRKSV